MIPDRYVTLGHDAACWQDFPADITRDILAAVLPAYLSDVADAWVSFGLPGGYARILRSLGEQAAEQQEATP